MKKCIFKWLKDESLLLLSKIFVYLTLIATFCVFCVQIYDRCKFHELIKDTAIEETKKVKKSIIKDTVAYVMLPADKKTYNDTTNIIRQFSVSNHISKMSSCRNCDSNDVSLLDVMTKSDGLMSANGLTFCITLIISLLATLVVIKIETNERVIKEIIERETASQYINTSKFNHLLARVESIYNLSIIIGNSAILLRQNGNENNEIIAINIGNLCSRLSPICNEIDDRLTKRGSRLDSISMEEKDMLNMYFEDTLGELRRSMSFAKHTNNTDLCIIIRKVIQSVESIKETIDTTELR